MLHLSANGELLNFKTDKQTSAYSCNSIILTSNPWLEKLWVTDGSQSPTEDKNSSSLVYNSNKADVYRVLGNELDGKFVFENLL